MPRFAPVSAAQQRRAIHAQRRDTLRAALRLASDAFGKAHDVHMALGRRTLDAIALGGDATSLRHAFNLASVDYRATIAALKTARAEYGNIVPGSA